MKSNLKGKVIILNAPPGAGKDVIALAFSKMYGTKVAQFKYSLYKETAEYFNIPLAELITLCTDRQIKEVPNRKLQVSMRYMKDLADVVDDFNPPLVQPEKDGEYFFLVTPRQSLIFVSEVLRKPVEGLEYFGKLAADQLDTSLSYIFSDGGFDEEVKPIVDKFGAENVIVVKFTGQGKVSFGGDSRDWISPSEGIRVLYMTNDRTVQEFCETLYQHLIGLGYV